MICPREPDPRSPLTPEWGRALLAYVRSLEPRSGQGIKIRRGPGGTVIKSFAESNPLPPPSAAAAVVTTPFNITDASVLSGTPVAKVLVGYGIVNSGTPTYSGTSLSLAPLITLTSAATWLIYIKWNVGAGVGIVDITTGALPADDATFSYNIIGEADVIASGGGFIVSAIRQAKVSSLTVQSCGGSLYFWGAQ